MAATFLWTKRSARWPNRIGQEIKHLEPGKWYSLKLVTADYQELMKGESALQKHAVSVQIDGAKIVREKSFQLPMSNNYAHTMGAFKEQNRASMNYHFILFRPERPSANLTISD